MMTQAEVLTDTLQGVAGAVTTGNFHLFFVVVCL